MNNQQHNRATVAMLIAVCMFQTLCIVWESMNGGVLTHHFFMRKDLPGISNWWGFIILPVLVLLVSLNIKKRAAKLENLPDSSQQLYRNAGLAFAVMLIVSVAQSIVFSLGYHQAAMLILLGLLVAALVFPLHRGEYILGYVLGSTFVSGSAMPFVGVVLFSVISMLIHLWIKPLVLKKRLKQSGLEKTKMSSGL
ncbi:hypothetical protein ACSLBF_13115 [Pseudoalteromonas sp. T1lg65]|uniref:hypothetical protein n=1 Tax=Pseudoalteromonas sp. T1lg65 TaxID=2077101 RepID=UPI003F79C865